MENLTNKYLHNILKNDRIGHAYLFYSTREEELEAYVNNFVKAMFCLENVNKEFFSCNSCKICKQITHGNYVDFYIVEVENNIRKEDVLNLKYEMSTKPTFSRKIYWIKNVDKMTPQAANSILKFLEEPEEKITAILTTVNLNSVLDTIVSRCQVVNVGSKIGIETRLVSTQSYDDFLQMYKKNKFLSVLELINTMENKEMVESFIDYMLKEITASDKVENKVELLSIFLNGKKELSMNVNYNLVIESVLFNIIKKDIELDG